MGKGNTVETVVFLGGKRLMVKKVLHPMRRGMRGRYVCFTKSDSTIGVWVELDEKKEKY